MFKKLFALFLAVSIFVISSSCIHALSGFSVIPVSYGMAFLNNDEHCAGENTEMNCCYDTHSGYIKTVNVFQSQKILMHILPVMHLPFCELYLNFKNTGKKPKNIGTVYQPPPRLAGIIVKKE